LQKELSMIRRNIALETRLIDDLLDLSRVVNGKMTLYKQEIDVHPLILNVVEMVSADSQQKQLQVNLELDAKHDRMKADSARLHQVLWNLLNNAIKFTPEKGTITVRTRNDGTMRLLIEVQDSGIGIEPAGLPSIFNAFDQGQHGANRAFGGLGLGLAISKAVVDMHEGKIFVTSEGAGRGACFSLELPTLAVREPMIHANPATSRGGNGQTRSLRILLVDDHPDTLLVLQRLLQAKGHAVTIAGSVAEAVREADKNRFDILISDIGLPDGTGLDLMRQIRLRYPKLPGIALTGFGMEQDVRNSEEAGFQVHLTKPLDLKQLETVFGRLALA
jgi:CheY-like chemotaxis protein